MAPIPVMATVNPTASADNKTLPPTLKGLVVFLSRKTGNIKKACTFVHAFFMFLVQLRTGIIMGQNLLIAPSLLCIIVCTLLAHTNAMAIAIGRKGEAVSVVCNLKGRGVDLRFQQIFPHLSAGDCLPADLNGIHILPIDILWIGELVLLASPAVWVYIHVILNILRHLTF